MEAHRYYHETGHFTESQAIVEHAQSIAEAIETSMNEIPEDRTKDIESKKELVALLAETSHNLGCIGTESNQPELTLLHFSKFNKMMVEKFDEQL